MAEREKRSVGRWLLRIVFASIAAVFLLIAIGVIVLYSRPRPSAESLAAAEERYREVRALYPGATTTTLAAVAASPTPAAPATTETLQARCDRLYLDLLVPADFMDGLNPYRLKDKMDSARQLAGLFDSGVRVSAEARSHYRHVHNRALMAMADYLWQDAVPTGMQMGDSYDFKDPDPAARAKRFERLILTLKYLRMIDCSGEQWNNQAMKCLNLYAIQMEKLPPELAAIDLGLISPRRVLDFQAIVALQLDYLRDARKVYEQMMKPGVVFQYVHEHEFRTEHGDWFIKASKYLACAASAVLYPPLYGAKTLDQALKFEKAHHDYAAALAKGPSVPPVMMFSPLGREMRLYSRLVAGAIGLRRGDPIPPPEQIGPDSYFFDPVLQKPYKMYRERNVHSSDPQSAAYLYIRRPYVVESGVIQEYDIIRIPLPSDHPGLENVPGLRYGDMDQNTKYTK
ncbi:MAG: hypothetical protein ABFD69_06590 [Candidatus Sumerlaeia bacterium]